MAQEASSSKQTLATGRVTNKPCYTDDYSSDGDIATSAKSKAAKKNKTKRKPTASSIPKSSANEQCNDKLSQSESQSNKTKSKNKNKFIPLSFSFDQAQYNTLGKAYNNGHRPQWLNNEQTVLIGVNSIKQISKS